MRLQGKNAVEELVKLLNNMGRPPPQVPAPAANLGL